MNKNAEEKSENGNTDCEINTSSHLNKYLRMSHSQFFDQAYIYSQLWAPFLKIIIYFNKQWKHKHLSTWKPFWMWLDECVCVVTDLGAVVETGDQFQVPLADILLSYTSELFRDYKNDFTRIRLHVWASPNVKVCLNTIVEKI